MSEQDAEARAIIRDYVEYTLEAGGQPDAIDFIAEYNTPGTRWDYDAVEAEIELYTAIRQYVAKCRETGEKPDAFSFSVFNYPQYGNIPGGELQQIINELEDDQTSDNKRL